MRLIIIIAMILLSARPAAAQPADPDRPRLTVGVSTLHQFTVLGGYESNPVPLGLHAGWRMNDRLGLHTDIVQ